MHAIFIASTTLGILLTLFLLWAAIVSFIENEKLAASRLLLISPLIPAIYAAPLLLTGQTQTIIAAVLATAPIIIGIILFFPVRGKNYITSKPKGKIDERNIMFARAKLQPGTERYHEYYKEFPAHLKLDNEFRTKPGLLSKNARYYDQFSFMAADAAFFTVAQLHTGVEGKPSTDKATVNPDEFSRFIKGWLKQNGALHAGITTLEEHHKYSKTGRGDQYGQDVVLNHDYVAVFTVEMDKVMIDSAPEGPTVMESAHQYLKSGALAVQLAEFIRLLGFEARAHIDGNYRIVAPLAARDAGLGEIGRMGLLITPSHGPRVRIGAVSFSAPVTVDTYKKENSVLDFCTICKKCADVCPSRAISFEPMKEENGVHRWQINQESCFTFWTVTGTDCGRCMAVCPYSHPDNLLHNIVRTGLKQSALFRRAALKADDLLYLRRPKTKEWPEWIPREESKIS